MSESETTSTDKASTLHRHRRVLVSLVGLTVIALLAWYFAWDESSTARPPFPKNLGILSDGSSIGLVGITTESPHEYFNPDDEGAYTGFVAGLPRKIRESVFRFFPESLDNRAEIPPDEDYLGIWLERNSTTMPPVNLQLRISSSDGNHATMPWTQVIWWSHRGNQLHGVRVVHFPQRAKMLTLELEELSIGGRWTSVARWDIANPKRRTDPPARKPTATNQSFAGYDLRLARARTASETNWRGTTGTGTVLEFNLALDEKPSTDWRIERISMNDADGNRLIATEASFSTAGGTTTWTAWGDYRTHEFPLSVNVRVAPSPHAPADLLSRFQQRWTVTNINTLQIESGLELKFVVDPTSDETPMTTE